MKILKNISRALVAMALVAGFASCSDDNYEGAVKPTNSQVYFPNENSTQYLLAENQSSVQVEVRRIKKDGAVSVPVTSTDESGLFTVASTVSFADGDSVAYIPVTFNFSSLTADMGYDIDLKLDTETSSYGDDQTTITIKYAPWTEWEPYGWKYPSGINTFSDWETAYANAKQYTDIAQGGADGLPVYTYAGYYSGTGSQPTFYRESQLDDTQAQLMLYDWGSGINLTINWDKTTDLFTVEQTYLTSNANYGSVYVADRYAYWHDYRGQDVTKEQVLNTSFDKDNGLFTFALSYFVSAGYFGDGNEYLQLPGYTKVDYSLTLEDGGAYQNGQTLGEVVDMTFGADVASIKYAAFAGNLSAEEIAEKADGIFSGDIESTSTVENGKKVILVDEEGEYTLVAVIYDKDGSRVGTESLVFNYKKPTAEETWTALYTGDYVYNYAFANEDGSPVTDSGLTLYQSDSDPTHFKIEHWGYDVDFTFTMNNDGSILVDHIATGATYQGASVYVDDLVTITGGTSYGQSSYDQSTHTFNFAVYYGVEGMSGTFGYGYETFTLTGNAAKAMKQAKKTVAKSAKRNIGTKLVKKQFGQYITVMDAPIVKK